MLPSLAWINSRFVRVIYSCSGLAKRSRECANPRISYHAGTGRDLEYASWNTWIVDSAGNVGQDTSVALDASGKGSTTMDRSADADS